MSNFSDRLLERAEAIRSRVIVGLDPDVGRFPGYLQSQLRAEPTEERLQETVFEFNRAVIEATAADAVAYKPQSAFYEQYGLAGMTALCRTVAFLRERGLIIILDAKRNDIAHTAGAYATAWIADRHPLFDVPNPCRVDAITINGYLGSDGVQPFKDVNPDAGLFVLVKTSNPSSGEIQDLPLADGRTVSEKMAEWVDRWGKSHVGERHFSSVGMVVGATYPETASRLRELAPHALFLMPGIGAQGGSLRAVVAGSGQGKTGAFAASSRGVMYPFQPEELADKDWRSTAMARMGRASAELRNAIYDTLKE